MHVAAGGRQRHRRSQLRDSAAGGESSAMLLHLQVVCLPSVIESRRALEVKFHVASDRADHSHDAMPVRHLFRFLYRHEIFDLSDAGLGHEPRDEDRGVGQIELAHHSAAIFWRNLEVAAFLVVKQGGKDAGRVESRAAEPVDGAALRDQRCRLQVSDHAMGFDRRVSPASRRNRSGSRGGLSGHGVSVASSKSC